MRQPRASTPVYDTQVVVIEILKVVKDKLTFGYPTFLKQRVS